MHWIKTIVIFSLTLLLSASCGNLKKETQKQPEALLFQQDKTLYLQIEVIHTDDSYKFNLLKKTQYPVKAKGIFPPYINEKCLPDGKWIVTLMGEGYNITQLSIKDPLTERYEVPGDNGDWQSGNISHNSGTINIRIPYTESLKNIKFEIKKEGKITPLGVLSIP